jgi:starch phosphorylase
MEACGTSGMKASLNGVPNLSALDGWWLEGFNSANGWAFEGKNNESDANAVYDLLERDIIPRFYKVDETGVPVEWVRVMKEAMKSNGPAFSARRMVKEYATRFYQIALNV